MSPRRSAASSLWTALCWGCRSRPRITTDRHLRRRLLLYILAHFRRELQTDPHPCQSSLLGFCMPFRNMCNRRGGGSQNDIDGQSRVDVSDRSNIVIPVAKSVENCRTGIFGTLGPTCGIQCTAQKYTCANCYFIFLHLFHTFASSLIERLQKANGIYNSNSSIRLRSRKRMLAANAIAEPQCFPFL